jgi:uncharacterized membrane protein
VWEKSGTVEEPVMADMVSHESDADRAKRPISALLTGPYGHPFHPILVTVPIGAWVSSLVFDIASRADQGQAFSTGARWLIGIGVLGALAAATVGFLDFLVIPSGTPAYRTALTHMGLNLAVTAAFAGSFAWRLAANDSKTGWAQLALSVVALAGLAVSGALGGRLAYHYGVRVADEHTQLSGFQRSHSGERPPTVADITSEQG